MLRVCFGPVLQRAPVGLDSIVQRGAAGSRLVTEWCCGALQGFCTPRGAMGLGLWGANHVEWGTGPTGAAHALLPRPGQCRATAGTSMHYGRGRSDGPHRGDLCACEKLFVGVV